MSGSTARRTWVAAFVATFICLWAGNQFTPLLLLYKQNHGYADVTVSIFLGAYVVGLVPGLLFAARLSDRYGRRPLMFVALTTGLLASVTLIMGMWGPLWVIVGRVLAGLSVAIASATGSSWLKELSQPPFDTKAAPLEGAQRASLAVTLGSLLGAGVAGTIAQVTSWGEWLPYSLHLTISLLGLVLLPFSPDTVSPPRVHGQSEPRRNRDRPRARDTTLGMRVLTAPWLFIAASIIYGYLPVLLGPHTAGLGIAYATLLSTVFLLAAAATQPLVKRHLLLPRRGVRLGLLVMAAGLFLAAAAAGLSSVWIGVASAAVSGVGFGIGLVSELAIVQRSADVGTLAARTGVFYALAFSGFIAPTIVAMIARAVPVGIVIVSVASVALLTALFIPRTRQDAAQVDSTSTLL